MLVDHDFRELFADADGPASSSAARTNPRATTLIPVRVSCEDAELTAACLDISAGGAFLRTSRLLAVGSAVSVDIDLPTGRVMASGIVRWAQVDRDGLEGVGVQLAGLSPQGGEAIAAYRAARRAGRGGAALAEAGGRFSA